MIAQEIIVYGREERKPKGHPNDRKGFGKGAEVVNQRENGAWS